MKKIMALLLALALLTASFGALAEEVLIPESAHSFDLSLVVPEGYTMGESQMIEELSLTEFTPDDPEAKPVMTLAIAYSEEYEGVSMTRDMTDDDIKALYDIVDDGYTADHYTVDVTDDGWKYLKLLDSETDNGYASYIMIHNGYFIETFAAYADFRPLTEEELSGVTKLMDSFVIVDVE